jgi:hypothetical protein
VRFLGGLGMPRREITYPFGVLRMVTLEKEVAWA